MKFYASQDTYKHTYTLTHVHTHSGNPVSEKEGELSGTGGKEEQMMKVRRKEIHSM